MSDPVPHPELLPSLGRLVRGLSALFWGLPASLIICVGTAAVGWFKVFVGVVPPLAATGLLLFGLWELGAFQKQERPWRAALDRARLFGLINCGLSPFLYFWSRVPDQLFFVAVLAVLAFSGWWFLFSLNGVLLRLGAMLPDEALRVETRQYTRVNRGLLLGQLIVAAIYPLSYWLPGIPGQVGLMLLLYQNSIGVILLFLLLLPLAMTMALLWKTKEVILDSVFRAK